MNKKFIKFSVIVPVYNVQEYLKKCIDSILAQDYPYMEILLIDDGSRDCSGLICEQYAKKYERVKVFHKKNGGLSDARNYGLERVSGDYVVFVDSDDWIELGCFTEFAKVISNNYPDILETRLIEVYKDETIYRDSHLKDYLMVPFTKERAMKWMLNISENTWPAPKRIYASSYIKKYNLRFLEGKLHEDIDWTSKICYTAETFAACDFPWYYHRMQRIGSITNSIHAKNITDVIEIASLHYQEYKKNPSTMKKMTINRIMESVYVKLNQVKRCTIDDKKKVISCVNDNKEIFKIAPTKKYKFFVLMMKILGTKKVLSLLSRI